MIVTDTAYQLPLAVLTVARTSGHQPAAGTASLDAGAQLRLLLELDESEEELFDAGVAEVVPLTPEDGPEQAKEREMGAHQNRNGMGMRNENSQSMKVLLNPSE